MSKGLQVTASYTYSHTLDGQSGLGLFFTGNDVNNLKSAYGNSDFDRTHVLSVSYLYEFPKLDNAKGVLNQVVNGWGMSGVTTLQSGQPYSVNDFSGGAASIYWGAAMMRSQIQSSRSGGLGPPAIIPAFKARPASMASSQCST